MHRQTALVLEVVLLSTASVAAQSPVADGRMPTAGLPDLPTYTVPRATDAIRIDGRLEEATWAAAPRVGPFRLIHDPARTPVSGTEATLAWNDAHLFVAFTVNDREAWGRLRNRDDRLWQEEVVEVFLDPDGDGRNYAELEVSPHNVVVDLLIAQPGGGSGPGRRWDVADLQTAVTRNDAGWVCEIAIPWRALEGAGVSAPPRAGDRWRAGLYRIDRPGGPDKANRIASLLEERKTATPERAAAVDQQVQGLRSDDEYSAWSVTRADRGFHHPERFGTLVFGTAPSPP